MIEPPRAIRMIVVSQTGELKVGFSVGINGVTRIEEYEEPGMYCGIPYLRVWKDRTAIGEFCKHGVVGIYFNEQPAAVPDQASARAQCEAGFLDLKTYIAMSAEYGWEIDPRVKQSNCSNAEAA